MTYLQALRLMVKAYKAAKGIMPKGLDLLKMKMKARQKAIDSQKVVQAADRFDKGNWFKLNRKPAKEGFGKPKKVETEAEMLARMKRQNKEAAQRLRDKQKPRDDKANGGSPNLPFPFFYEGARPGGMPLPSLDYYDDDAGVKGLMKKRKKKKKKREDKAGGGITDAIKKIKRRFGKKSITTGDKIKRPGNRQLFEDFKKRNKFNVGGMANLSQTYDNNPTLQAQFPNKQDYLDLFGGIASTTVAQTTTPMMTQQAAQSPVIKPIKPIIPQGDDGDGGGEIPGRTGYGYSGPSMTLDDIGVGTVTAEEEAFAQGQALRGLAEKTLLGNLFFKAKDAVSDRARDIANQFREEEIAKAEALKSLQQAIARNQARASQQDWSGASSDYSGGFDASTGNYDDPYSPGDTE